MSREAGGKTVVSAARPPLLPRSRELYRQLCEVIPGGVNSPFRGFQHGAAPDAPPLLVARRGRGARLEDVDGASYLDYVCAFGPLILGHAHPEVMAAAREALEAGSVFGASTEAELELARLVTRLHPGMDMVRFVNSGAEAVQAAVRLARAATGRAGLVKLEGGYHGHVESLDTADPGGDALASGVPAAVTAPTRVVPFGDADALAALLAREAGSIAAVVVEPVSGSMGVIAPPSGYLSALRDLCTARGVLLIFDEVLTGFRVALGGAQERYGVRPDLTALGKILGGGFPAGAYGGRRDLMARVAPLGPMYQAGTFSGNPVSMRAGLETLRLLQRPGTYERLEALTRQLVEGIQAAADRHGVAVQTPAVGSMFSVLFVDGPVRNMADFQRCDDARFAAFFHGMLRRGVLLPPSQSDAAVVSLAHTEADVDETVAAAEAVLRGMRDVGAADA